MEEYDKKRVLYEILEKVMDGSKVLIFTSTKRTADDLTASLRQDGWPARAIHGDKSQSERDWVLQEFRTGRSPLMIATDVASRGLDVKDIKVGTLTSARVEYSAYVSSLSLTSLSLWCHVADCHQRRLPIGHGGLRTSCRSYRPCRRARPCHHILHHQGRQEGTRPHGHPQADQPSHPTRAGATGRLKLGWRLGWRWRQVQGRRRRWEQVRRWGRRRW